MNRASMTDFRRVADDVRNWGRWGDDDEIGTLNFITAEKVAEAASLVRHGKVFPLGVDFGSSGPQGAFHYRHNPIHMMTVDGGDANTLAEYGPIGCRTRSAEQLSGYSEDGPFRFNDDLIIMPLQAATQWDALSHVYYEDTLYNGFPASSVTSLGAFHCGIDKVDVKGITSRGVLLDLVRLRASTTTSSTGNPITPAELDDAARAQGVAIGPVGHRAGPYRLVGKVSRDRRQGRACAGLDWTMRVVAARPRDRRRRGRQPHGREPGIRGRGHDPADAHVCLRDMGMMFGEYWDLTALAEDCAADGVYEFQLVAPPLRVIGAVGSPVNPIAIK